MLYRHTSFSCSLLHFSDTAFFFFLQIEGLWQPCMNKFIGAIFSNSIFSFHVSVSHFGNSCNNSNFKNDLSVCDGDLCSVIVSVTAMTH